MKNSKNEKPQPEQKLLKFREFAQAISVSTRQLWRMIDRGDAPRPVKQGRINYFFTEDLENHLTKLRQQRS